MLKREPLDSREAPLWSAGIPARTERAARKVLLDPARKARLPCTVLFRRSARREQRSLPDGRANSATSESVVRATRSMRARMPALRRQDVGAPLRMKPAFLHQRFDFRIAAAEVPIRFCRIDCVTD